MEEQQNTLSELEQEIDELLDKEELARYIWRSRNASFFHVSYKLVMKVLPWLED